MSKAAFDKIAAGLREAIAIARGEIKVSVSKRKRIGPDGIAKECIVMRPVKDD